MAPPPPKGGEAPEAKIIMVRVVGGEAGATSSLAPKLGPLGLSPKKIGDDLAKATKDWKGLRVACQLSVVNRVATITVMPSTASLIIKALKEPVRDRKKEKDILHNGALQWDDVLDIARQKRESGKSMARTLQGSVMEVLGTANSVGCTIEGTKPSDVQDEIRDGSREVPAE